MHFKLIVVVTRTDLTTRVLDTAKKAGATGATIVPARGTGIKEAKTFFGLTLETQRDLLLFIVEEHLVQEILPALESTGEFDKAGTGIAFVVDLESVIGLESQLSKFREEVCNHYS